MRIALFALLTVAGLAGSGCCCLKNLCCHRWHHCDMCCDDGCDECCEGEHDGCDECGHGHGSVGPGAHDYPDDGPVYEEGRRPSHRGFAAKPHHGHPLVHERRDSGGHYEFDQGPPTGAVTYPYYTNRGPRDFLARQPRSIGP